VTAQLLHTPEGAAEELALSRTKIFNLIKSGELRSVKIGRARRIPASALEEYVARLQEAA
jgi:excisionase family DNA binding protein